MRIEMRIEAQIYSHCLLENARTPMEMEERLTAIDNHEINVRSFAKNTLGSIWKKADREEKGEKEEEMEIMRNQNINCYD